jgi:hypothetical membrane protein
MIMAMGASEAEKRTDKLYLSALCAVIGPLLFIGIFTLLGIINPQHSAIRQQISVLATEPYGTLLNAGFIIGGLLTIIGVIIICQNIFMQRNTIIKLSGIILLSIPPLGMILCGIFPFNSPLSFMHFIGANLGCTFPVVSFIAFGIFLYVILKNKILGMLLVIAGLLTVFCIYGYFHLSGTTFEDIKTIEGGGTLGLWERILVIEILFWYILLGAMFSFNRLNSVCPQSRLLCGQTHCFFFPLSCLKDRQG